MANPSTLSRAQVRVEFGAEFYWKVMCDLSLEGTFTVADIRAKSTAHNSAITGYVSKLVKAGFLSSEPVPLAERNEWGSRLRFRVIKRQAEPPRFDRSGGLITAEFSQETLWRTMKMLGRFTVEELATHASTSAHHIPISTVSTYVSLLIRADVIGVAAQRKNKKRASLWLKKNLGARAPQILRSQMVFDPNSNEVVGEAVARRAAR